MSVVSVVSPGGESEGLMGRFFFSEGGLSVNTSLGDTTDTTDTLISSVSIPTLRTQEAPGG